jgi:hypothetical protein
MSRKHTKRSVSPKWRAVGKNGKYKTVPFGETMTEDYSFRLVRVLGTGVCKKVTQRPGTEKKGKWKEDIPFGETIPG